MISNNYLLWNDFLLLMLLLQVIVEWVTFRLNVLQNLLMSHSSLNFLHSTINWVSIWLIEISKQSALQNPKRLNFHRV